MLSQLSRAFHYRDRHIFLRLYIQYVRPHLECAVAAWSPWFEADKECLEKVQRRAVNMITKLRATSYEGKLSELGLTTLVERRNYLDMVQTYKILHEKDNVKRSTWFEMASDSQRATRQAADPLNFKPKASKLEIRKTFFSQRVPVVERWNGVPAEVKRAETVSSFINGHRNYLKANGGHPF